MRKSINAGIFFHANQKKFGDFFLHHDFVYNNLMWQTQKSEKNMIQVLIYAEIQAATEWNGNRYKKKRRHKQK